MPDQEGITCPICLKTSYSEEDKRYGYCVGCDIFWVDIIRHFGQALKRGEPWTIETLAQRVEFITYWDMEKCRAAAVAIANNLPISALLDPTPAS